MQIGLDFYALGNGDSLKKYEGYSHSKQSLNSSNNIFDRNAYTQQLKTSDAGISEILRPRILKESNVAINSYINPVETFRRDGNYTIKNENSNYHSFELKRNMLYAKEGTQLTTNNTKKLSLNEFNNMKKSISNNIPDTINTSNEISKPIKHNDMYFYKNMAGIDMKKLKNFNSYK